VDIGLSCTKIANTVRIDLTAAHPGVRFSIRPVAPNASLPATISVTWKDGPTEAQVRELTCKYLVGPDAKPITLTTARGHTFTGRSHVTAFNLNRTTTKPNTQAGAEVPSPTASSRSSWFQRSRKAACRIRPTKRATQA
jgi:hypothetical protein